MYLATVNNRGVLHYQIRSSVKVAGKRFSQELVFDLGNNPADHFEVFNENIILFSSPLTEAAEANLGRDAESVLEHILFRFFPPEVRHRLDLFRHRKRITVSPLSNQDREDIDSQIHMFDRRRLYYLRYGGVDQSRLYKMHEKTCRPLLGQCRDEREFYFADEEQVLRPREYFSYIYAIFNLRTYFSQSFAPWFPEGLARDSVADHFIDEICNLNRDLRFWQDDDDKKSLHPHLIRYLIMFFDFQPVSQTFFDDYLRRFMNSHRQFKWPDQQSPATPDQMSTLFATSYNDLKTMAKSELTRLYRQKALELHPDKGGDHELFIELTTAYKYLLKHK